MAQTDSMDECMWAGCGKASTGFCMHCRAAGYCTLEHAVRDYERHHAQECAACIQTSAGAVMWGVEVEVGQSQGAKEQSWEPVDLVHARVDERGVVKSFVSNRDLLEAIGREVVGGFQAREVFPGSRVNMVQAGKRRTDNPYTTVYLSMATGGKQTLRLEINPTLSDRDVASLTGRGTTVRVTQKDITAKYGTNLPAILEEGTAVVGIRIGGEAWQVWGAYNLVEQKDADSVVVRTYQSARAGSSRLARRALGHEEVVRLRGFDRNRIGASVAFRRMGKDVDGQHIYQVQEIEIHVPETGGQTDPSREFLSAAEVGPYTDDGTGTTSYPVFDAATGALEKTVQTTRDGLKGAVDLLTGLDAQIHTAVTMAPLNPENRVHVAALINMVAAKHAELKQLFQEEQLTSEPADVKRIQQELTEVARVRSVLETHLATLAAEASGEKVAENISSDVYAAMAQTHDLIGISLSDRMNRSSDTRKIRKRAKTMSKPDATAAFLQAVADAQAAQKNGQVGTDFIRRANIYYERLQQVSGHGQDSVQAAAVTLQQLKATERNRYKGKQQRKKQQQGQVDAEEEDRLASGK
jgi:hypothetical protein